VLLDGLDHPQVRGTLKQRSARDCGIQEREREEEDPYGGRKVSICIWGVRPVSILKAGEVFAKFTMTREGPGFARHLRVGVPEPLHASR